MTRAIAAGVAMLVLPSTPLASQSRDTLPSPARAMVASVPETVTVGDRFHAYLRLAIPPGTRVTFPEFVSDDSLQRVGPARVDTTAVDTLTAVYPLVAWVAGEPLRAVVELSLEAPDGRIYAYPVPLRLPRVESVLPARGEVEPRPPKGLMLAEGVARGWWWLWLWLLLAALGVVAAAWALLRRRRRSEGIDPREEALRQLEALEESSAFHTPDVYYSEITRVLRRYLSAVEPAWSEDLTTSELALRMPLRGGRRSDRGALEELLRRADPVKFGGLPPAEGEAERFPGEVRAWIIANPVAEPERREEAA